MAEIGGLVEWFGGKGRVMVALSGGVDSALVAYAAFAKLGDSAVAVTADYKTLSEDELAAAKGVCSEIGIRQILLDYDELENGDFVRNDSNRCFYCRMELGERLAGLAKEHGADLIVDGTNTDDLGDYRPGIEALRRHGIRSPLVEAGFAKSDVRRAARDAGLSVHDRPSNSCLASRSPWGQRVTAEGLVRIELAEKMVRKVVGTGQVRVRDIGGTAKIEVDAGAVALLQGDALRGLEEGLEVIGFGSVQVDPEGYRPGKINVIAD